ncbi:putative membrane protein [Neisseria meningitidis NM133]|nr:putative membrane protein [Neisseria meningitidis NM133]
MFWVLALLTATARPIVNLDYLPAALLITLPWRFVKIAGVLAFWLAVLFDGLMMVIQLFPFMDLIGAINLVPFILTAPAPYQIMTGLLLLYMLAMPFVLQNHFAQTTSTTPKVRRCSTPSARMPTLLPPAWSIPSSSPWAINSVPPRI